MGLLQRWDARNQRIMDRQREQPKVDPWRSDSGYGSGAGILGLILFAMNVWRARHPDEKETRTFECPLCGRSVEVSGTSDGSFPLTVSASEVAALCRRQNGTTHAGRAHGVGRPTSGS